MQSQIFQIQFFAKFLVLHEISVHNFGGKGNNKIGGKFNGKLCAAADGLRRLDGLRWLDGWRRIDGWRRRAGFLIIFWLLIHAARGSCRYNSECENGGKCQNSKNSSAAMTCQCQRGFSGSTCQNFDCHTQLNPCQNGGTCHKPKCSCTDDWEGADCSLSSKYDCGPCLNGGRCNHNKGSCTCVGRFGGTDCSEISENFIIALAISLPSVAVAAAVVAYCVVMSRRKARREARFADPGSRMNQPNTNYDSNYRQSLMTRKSAVAQEGEDGKHVKQKSLPRPTRKARKTLKMKEKTPEDVQFIWTVTKLNSSQRLATERPMTRSSRERLLRDGNVVSDRQSAEARDSTGPAQDA